MTSRTQVLHCCEACGQPVDDWESPVALDGVRLKQTLLSYGSRERLVLRGTALLFRHLVLRGSLTHEAFTMLKETESLFDQASVYCCHLRRALRGIRAPIIVRSLYGWGYELRHSNGDSVTPATRRADALTAAPAGGIQSLHQHRRASRPRYDQS